jgi:hypothetical protein
MTTLNLIGIFFSALTITWMGWALISQTARNGLDEREAIIAIIVTVLNAIAVTLIFV